MENDDDAVYNEGRFDSDDDRGQSKGGGDSSVRLSFELNGISHDTGILVTLNLLERSITVEDYSIGTTIFDNVEEEPQIPCST